MAEAALEVRSTGTRHAALLRATAMVFAVAVLVHNGDHLRRGGDSVSAQVFWLGSAAMLVEVGVVALVLARHRLAPRAAVVAGLGLAAGYFITHFTPQRGLLSDSLVSGGASPLSLVAATFETVSALALGIAGAMVVHDGDWDGDEHVSAGAALGHPLVVALIVGNAVIFVGSLLTR